MADDLRRAPRTCSLRPDNIPRRRASQRIPCSIRLSRPVLWAFSYEAWPGLWTAVQISDRREPFRRLWWLRVKAYAGIIPEPHPAQNDTCGAFAGRRALSTGSILL